MADYSNTSNLAWIQFVQKKNELAAIGKILDEREELALFAQCVHCQILKSPATAIFPSLDQMYVQPVGPGRFKVSGFVDAQNSYGAMIRGQYNYSIERDYMGNMRCTDKFISNAASISGSVGSTMIAWWILGILGTIITFAISYFFVSSLY